MAELGKGVQNIYIMPTLSVIKLLLLQPETQTNRFLHLSYCHCQFFGEFKSLPSTYYYFVRDAAGF